MRALATPCFLLILTALLAASLWQYGTYDDPALRGKLLNGQATARLEKAYTQTFPWKDALSFPWSTMRYHLFGIGSKGAITGKNGWLFTDEEFTTTAEFEENLARNLAEIKQIQKQLAQRNIALVIALLPAKARMYPQYLPSPLPSARQQVYDRILAELSSPTLVDGRKALADMPHAFFRSDTHWTPEGAKAIAHAVAQQVQKTYPQLTPHFTTSFSTQRHGTKTFYSDLHKFFPDSAIPEESYTLQETISQASADLFSDPKISIGLVGTSYSADERWNFIGFLKEALHADVLNLAAEGQGALAPMRRFLKNTPPDIRLVIWEFPERFFARVETEEHAEKTP